MLNLIKNIYKKKEIETFHPNYIHDLWPEKMQRKIFISEKQNFVISIICRDKLKNWIFLPKFFPIFSPTRTKICERTYANTHVLIFTIEQD